MRVPFQGEQFDSGTVREALGSLPVPVMTLVEINPVGGPPVAGGEEFGQVTVVRGDMPEVKPI